MKKDDIKSRITAIARRIVQICAWAPPNLGCGLQVMVAQVLKEKKINLVLEPILKNEDDDDEEHYVDADETSEVKNTVPVKPSAESSGWMHRDTRRKNVNVTSYDPHHRNPLYANADGSPIYEMTQLSKHFHPSVSMFSHQLLKQEQVSCTGDPLQDFTVQKFLDRFVYRNPKKCPISAGLPEKKAVFGKRKLNNTVMNSNKIDVTSKEYVNLNHKKVPVEEQYLYQFFTQRTIDRKKKEADDDANSVNSDEFDELLDKVDWEDMKDEYDLDFAGDVASKPKEKKKKNEAQETADPDSDDQLNLSEDEDYNAAFQEFDEDIANAPDFSKGDEGEDGIGFDEEAISFSEDDDFEKSSKPVKKKKTKHHKALENGKGERNTAGRDLSGIMAEAEKFSALLDETGASKMDTTTAEALASKDNAHVKQLQWEMDRDKWIKGKGSWKKKGGFRKNPQKKEKRMTGGKKGGQKGKMRRAKR
jgi:ribosome biogenesis protein MAK21